MYNNKGCKNPGKWISKLYRVFISFCKKEIKTEGIGYGQISIIMNLAVEDGISQDSLAKKIDIDRTTLNRTIRPLLEQGYISKEINTQNRRANIITLTKKGKEILPDVTGKIKIWNDNLLNGFTKEEEEIFTSLLRRALNNVTRGDNE